MEKWIDLTHPIENEMPIYPDDISVELAKIKSYEIDGYNNYRFQTGMHTGTHIDGPMHMTGSNTYLSNIPLDTFTGRGKIISATDQNTILFRNELVEDILPGDIVLFHTGHDSLFKTETYYTDYPVLDDSWAQALIQKKVKMIGFDSPSPDRNPYTIHKELFPHGILILENLTNVQKLISATNFEIFAFPLKIQADSSIVRVVARILD